MFLPLSGRAALLGAALTAFCVGVAADADAAPGDSKKPVAVRIASPRPNALAPANAVPIRIVTGPKVTAIKVFDGTRDVTRKFKRDGSIWRAKLALKPGSHRLLVQSKTGRRGGNAKRVKFIAGRSAPASASVLSGASASASLSQGPVGTHSYQPTPGQVPVSVRTKAPSIATLTVNGHKVADRRGRRFLRDHSWLVSARDGLRTGNNRLVLKTYDRRGRYAVKRWTVKRDASLPLAEAGPRERVVKPNAFKRLDGTATKATRRGVSLSYAWRVVKAPKGAKPQLRNANSPKPTFKADVTGVYQVALRVTQTRRSGARAAAASTTASEDVITLDAAPPVPSQGMYVDTGFYGAQDKMTPPYNSFWFWGAAYPAFTGDPNLCLQLDDTTLGLVAYGMPKDVTPQEGRVTICAWGATSLTGDNAVSWMPFSESNGSAIFIGTTLVATNRSNQNWTPDTGNPTSNLHGWLQPASGPNEQATWVDSDMLRVQTRAAIPNQGTNANTIDVNGSAYTVTLPAGDTGGFELLLLNNYGAPTGGPTIYGFSGDATADLQSATDLAGALDNARANHYTVLLQGFGTLPDFDPLNPLLPAIQDLGGRSEVLGMLNGAQDANGAAYALVAGAYTTPKGVVEWTAREASAERTPNGRVSALLVRDSAANDYIPFTSDTGLPDPVGEGHSDLLPLAYAPPTGWDAWIEDGKGGFRAPTAAETQAFSDIQGKMVNNGTIDPANPTCTGAPDAVRGALCNVSGTDLGSIASDVRAYSFDPTLANGRYTSADFATVQSTIGDEFSHASTIAGAISDDYVPIFGTAKINGIVDANTIGGWITADIAKSESDTNTNYAAFMSALTDIASVDEEVGGAMTILSGAFSLDSNYMPNSTPTQDLENDIAVTQQTAVADLVSGFESATLQLYDLINNLATDPVKLQQGAKLFNGEYAISPDNLTRIQYGAQYGTQKYLWGTLLAPAYATWTGPATLGLDPMCVYSMENEGYPFSNLDANGRWLVPDVPLTTQWWIAQSQPGYEWINDQTGVGLPPSDTDKLFGKVDTTQKPSSTTNVGAIMPYFALDYLPMQAVPINSNWTLPVTDDGCMADPYAH